MSAAATVRRAKPGDIEALLKLEALFPTDQMSRRSLRRFIAAPNAVFLVAEIADEVRGNLLLLTRRDSARARIYSVVVDPTARGLGLAQQLVIASQNAATQRGCDAVSLEVRSDNTAARALYVKLGYAIESELPGYYEDGGDGLRLVKTLRPAVIPA
jgi:ribosomal-protein-alanine N-acetyltransferase